jgi:hypothetical protein
MMRNKAWRILGAGIAVWGFLLGISFAQQTQTAPAKGPLQVTYYFLPG